MFWSESAGRNLVRHLAGVGGRYCLAINMQNLLPSGSLARNFVDLSLSFFSCWRLRSLKIRSGAEIAVRSIQSPRQVHLRGDFVFDLPKFARVSLK